MHITADTTFLSEPRVSASRVLAYIKRHPTGEYTEFSLETIINFYFYVCGRVKVDPLMVITQMLHETGHLTSWWAARPRRNPAGLGVTGEPGKGLWFPSWEHATMAHVGRLLAYALTDQEVAEDGERWVLIAAALYLRPLPDHLRGSAKTYRGLTGTWATDPLYADKMVRLANHILAFS